MHDFIEYDNSNNICHIKNPQWFHSACGVYIILNNIEYFNNPQINYLINKGLKKEILQISIDIILLDLYGR